ncbi:MAG: lysoplasmalogenase [Acidimicrobiia bacterium]|nr:lysoplasmalogenase [Acidimicrobiia bacterium]
MTAASTAFLALFVVVAAANWWSRWSDDARLERLTKPTALVALIGVALALDPVDPTVRTWFVVALVFSLAGDVFLLGGDERFVLGLASFLLAHIAYTVGFIVADDWRWIGFAVGAVLVGVLALTVGSRIVAGARRSSAALGPPVVAYLLVISAMAAAAAAAGNGWAIVGAALFVTSDSLLGWRQFVTPARWMAPAVMITYHLGQAGLVISLV